MIEPCRSCGAPMLWARTHLGKPMPLDVEPHPEGNIVVTRTDGRQPVAHVLKKGETPPEGAKLHRAHFVTCPQGPEWSKGKVPKDDEGAP